MPASTTPPQGRFKAVIRAASSVAAFAAAGGGANTTSKTFSTTPASGALQPDAASASHATAASAASAAAPSSDDAWTQPLPFSSNATAALGAAYAQYSAGGAGAATEDTSSSNRRGTGGGAAESGVRSNPFAPGASTPQELCFHLRTLLSGCDICAPSDVVASFLAQWRTRHANGRRAVAAKPSPLAGGGVPPTAAAARLGPATRGASFATAAAWRPVDGDGPAVAAPQPSSGGGAAAQRAFPPAGGGGRTRPAHRASVAATPTEPPFLCDDFLALCAYVARCERDDATRSAENSAAVAAADVFAALAVPSRPALARGVSDDAIPVVDFLGSSLSRAQASAAWLADTTHQRNDLQDANDSHVSVATLASFLESFGVSPVFVRDVALAVGATLPMVGATDDDPNGASMSGSDWPTVGGRRGAAATPETSPSLEAGLPSSGSTPSTFGGRGIDPADEASRRQQRFAARAVLDRDGLERFFAAMSAVGADVAGGEYDDAGAFTQEELDAEALGLVATSSGRWTTSSGVSGTDKSGKRGRHKKRHRQQQHRTRQQPGRGGGGGASAIAAMAGSLRFEKDPGSCPSTPLRFGRKQTAEGVAFKRPTAAVRSDVASPTNASAAAKAAASKFASFRRFESVRFVRPGASAANDNNDGNNDGDSSDSQSDTGSDNSQSKQSAALGRNGEGQPASFNAGKGWAGTMGRLRFLKALQRLTGYDALAGITTSNNAAAADAAHAAAPTAVPSTHSSPPSSLANVRGVSTKELLAGTVSSLAESAAFTDIPFTATISGGADGVHTPKAGSSQARVDRAGGGVASALASILRSRAARAAGADRSAAASVVGSTHGHGGREPQPHQQQQQQQHRSSQHQHQSPPPSAGRRGTDDDGAGKTPPPRAGRPCVMDYHAFSFAPTLARRPPELPVFIRHSFPQAPGPVAALHAALARRWAAAHALPTSADPASDDDAAASLHAAGPTVAFGGGPMAFGASACGRADASQPQPSPLSRADTALGANGGGPRFGGVLAGGAAGGYGYLRTLDPATVEAHRATPLGTAALMLRASRGASMHAFLAVPGPTHAAPDVASHLAAQQRPLPPRLAAAVARLSSPPPRPGSGFSIRAASPSRRVALFAANASSSAAATATNGSAALWHSGGCAPSANRRAASSRPASAPLVAPAAASRAPSDDTSEASTDKEADPGSFVGAGKSRPISAASGAATAHRGAYTAVPRSTPSPAGVSLLVSSVGRLTGSRALGVRSDVEREEPRPVRFGAVLGAREALAWMNSQHKKKAREAATSKNAAARDSNDLRKAVAANGGMKQ